MGNNTRNQEKSWKVKFLNVLDDYYKFGKNIPMFNMQKSLLFPTCAKFY